MGPIPASFWPEPRLACSTLLADALLKMYNGDVDVMFYSEFPLVFLSKVKNHFCGPLAILTGDSLALQCQKIDPNILKIPLFDGYIKLTYVYAEIVWMEKLTFVNFGLCCQPQIVAISSCGISRIWFPLQPQHGVNYLR